MLINSYHRTYGLEYVISRSGNNYGSRQYEEKLVAKSISCLREGQQNPATRRWLLRKGLDLCKG